MTGTITCDQGNRFRIGVTLTQGETEARAVATGTCTGDLQSFRVIVRATSGPGFEDGTAQAHAVAQVGDPYTRTVLDRYSTTEDVHIDVRDGMGGAMLSAIDSMESRRG